MYRLKDFVLLRNWTLGRNVEISLADIRKVFEEMIEAIGGNIGIRDIEIDGNLPGFALYSYSKASYMNFYVYTYQEKKETFIELAVEGKGEQVKATDLERFFQKAEGTVRNLYGGYQYSKNFMRRFGVGGTASSITAGISVATGAVLGGSVRLMIKGAMALMRDKVAYEKEMSFYALLLDLGDYLIGGNYANDFIPELTANGQNGNKIAQYLLATAYNEGRGIDVNLANAVKWYDMAAENGEERSRSILAYEYLFGETEHSLEQKKKGLIYLKELADKGEDNTIIDLLEIYWKGTVHGIPQNYEVAVKLAEEYSKKGSIFAKVILAQAYDTSPEYYHEDLMLFKNDFKAAEVNYQLLNITDQEIYIFAAKNLARMYFDGRGGEIPKKEIVRCMMILSDKGDINAKMNLAKWYTEGCNVEKDYAIARKFCNELLKTGNEEAVAVSYYCCFKIAHNQQEYKKSMEYAIKYVELEGGNQEVKKELKTYVVEMNRKISQMTDEERRIFLKERKPLFPGKNKSTSKEKVHGSRRKWLVVVGVIVLVGLMVFIFTNKDKMRKEDKTVSLNSGMNNQQQELYDDYIDRELIPQYGLATIGDISYEDEGCIGLVSGIIIDIDDDQTSELITLISETKIEPKLRLELYTIEDDNIISIGESIEPGKILESESMGMQDVQNEYSGASAEYYLKSLDGKTYIIEKCTGIYSGGSLYSESLTVYCASAYGIEQITKLTSGCDRGSLYGIVNGVEYHENLEDLFYEELSQFDLEEKIYIVDSGQMYSGMICFEGPNTENAETLLAKRERKWGGDYQSHVFDYTRIREGFESNDTSQKTPIGSTITYGEYNGKKIEWVVLEHQNDEMLLFAKYNFMEEKAYQEDGNVVSWEECSLRKWLNTIFYEDAFSKKEKERIVTHEVNNYEETGGNQPNTKDNVHILSRNDIDKYKEILNENAAVYEVDYVEEPYHRKGIGTQLWLRHMLDDGDNVWVDFINHYGEPDSRALAPDGEMNVRPAIWIKE